jgi:thiamine kinase-like enzyme
MQDDVFARCQAALPGWHGLTVHDFDFDQPKGFSSFTMGIRARAGAAAEPQAVLYRHLAGKENAVLDGGTERELFLLLGEHRIAARCLHYDDTCRIEEFFTGRTLTAEDVFEPEIQRGVANELYRLHQLTPTNLPERTFFELLHQKWGRMARTLLDERRADFPADEQALCDDLTEICSDRTMAKVMRCLPDRPPVFCHNDTYHGNVMLRDDGTIKLLDFEFSCRNHIAFDFANLFAETVMEHGLAEPPHFRIAAPRFTEADLASLIGYYLDNAEFDSDDARRNELTNLVVETRRMLMLSDYMYAMAALPLALEPIQRIRFLPYSHQRFHKFLAAWHAEFGSD